MRGNLRRLITARLCDAAMTGSPTLPFADRWCVFTLAAIVMDASGLAVTYVYYEEERGRRTAANLVTKDEARRIAADIVKLLGLLAVRMPALTQPWPPASPFQITTRRAGAD